MSEPNKAIFLSYASQDTEAARKICDALRTAGLEVWFDQSELRGGDAWDQKIRRQIRECALFMPVISAATNARPEGYFRLEWKLAVDRSHLIADDQPFLFPIVIGDVADNTARVPDKFREVQWTRLRLDETPAELARRVSMLLSGATENSRLRPDSRAEPRASGKNEKKSVFAYWWIIFPIFGMLMAFFPNLRPNNVARREEKAAKATPLTNPTVPPAAGPTFEARQLAAKALSLADLLDSKREDLFLAEDMIKQALAKDNTDAEVWAAQAQVQSLFIVRGFDHSPQRVELVRVALQRALRLDPDSFEARFASTLIPSNAGNNAVETEKTLRELRKERPKDQRVLRALGAIISREGRPDEAAVLDEESAALPGGDPLALYNEAWNFWYSGRPVEAEAALKASLAQKPFSSSLLADSFFKLIIHGDLDGAKAALNRVPPDFRTEDRGAVFTFFVYNWRREPDRVVAGLRLISRDWIDDTFYRGPRDLLAGDALASANRMEAAATAWRSALVATETRLANTPNDEAATIGHIYLLAMLDQKDKAATELRAWEQMNGNSASTGAVRPRAVLRIYLQLGRKAEVIAQLQALVAKPQRSGFRLTSPDLRLNPDWDLIRNDPAFPALIAAAEENEKKMKASASAKKE